jgi:alkane 1-monooxygenase
MIDGMGWLSSPGPTRFAVAWLFPLAVGLAAWRSPWAAWAVAAGVQVLLAVAERWPRLAHSPVAAGPVPSAMWIPRLHLLWQALLLGLGVAIAAEPSGHAGGAWAVVALGLGIGAVTGAQGITFAHELGHSRSRLDRSMAWMLMASVNYAHFMVEHYRGHHPRAATIGDPATARRGESLWRFLPRTLGGSWLSAWQLESQRLAQRRSTWTRSPLLWVCAAQGAWLSALGAVFGPWALLFWVVQSAYAIFLLETINYVEHYGLRRTTHGGRPEAFGLQHAWNADHWLTNGLLINLQRHSDHHMHAWKPFPELQPLPGPQLPTGYAGCLFLAAVPPLWFGVMHPRLDRLGARASDTVPEAVR